MNKVVPFLIVLFILLLNFELEARLVRTKQYARMEEIKYILKRTVMLVGLKLRKRVIQLMPLDSLSYIDTDKIKERSFRVRTVVGKTNCHVFDGECYLGNVTDVAIMEIHALRDDKGWLDILHVAEKKKTIYEYKD